MKDKTQIQEDWRLVDVDRGVKLQVGIFILKVNLKISLIGCIFLRIFRWNRLTEDRKLKEWIFIILSGE